MGRNLRSTLTQISSTLIPQWPYLKEFKHQNNLFKSRQKTNYDRRHRVLDLPDIPDVTDVWITTNGQPTTGRTVTTAGTPRSYTVQTRNGHIRRNRTSEVNLMLTHDNQVILVCRHLPIRYAVRSRPVPVLELESFPQRDWLEREM